ncbi:hypothetical protein [Methylotuvimicrobium sp.]|uniref:hypothetical protein n=1 Tax=Methylotuvimicrobium sp. TaxID=2822413 RepID=UPI003D65E32B
MVPKVLLEKQLTDVAEGIQAANTGTVTLDQSRVGRLSRIDVMCIIRRTRAIVWRWSRGSRRSK